MLTVIVGRAGTGKTRHVMEEIRAKGEAGETELQLIVPEQYSHSAERQLSAICGDRLSMYGETLSFKRLCTRVLSETGGAARHIIDGGGQILVMYRALDSVAPRLKVFNTKGFRAELLKGLLSIVTELKNQNITPEELDSMAEKAPTPLREKVRDTSLILNAYDTILHTHGGDSADRLTLLARRIKDSTVGDAGHIYFDGFNDFTAQELRVIENLLKKNAELSICLTCDLDSEDEEAFDLPRNTIRRLKRIAEETGVRCKIEKMGRGYNLIPKSDELVFLERHLFDHSPAEYAGECGAISVYAAPTKYAECEYAAYFARKLVSEGYRWRDIGVMARNWEDYGLICENIFEKYDVPCFVGGRSDVLDKPPAALIETALEIAVSGWEYKPVFRYLKTGLLDIAPDEIAELENYVIKWSIRGSLWAKDWTLPPHEQGSEKNDSTLVRLGSLRKKITEPLFGLRDGVKGNTEAGAKLRALYRYFEEIELPRRLREKAEKLEKRGETRLADEYVQLWEVIVNTMEQFFSILGDTKLSADEFKKIFTLVLSRYDIGVIPASLDKVALGSMEMTRRRDLKCLILLGATDDNMPMLKQGGGALSESEREELARLGLDIPAGIKERYSREMNMLYSTLTLPSEKLVLTYPTGGEERPSIFVWRIMDVFGLRTLTLREEEYMAAAPKPLSELATIYMGDSRERGRLSPGAVELLYGREVALSASRVDKYYLCPFQHFAHSGLRLSPRLPAGFDAPEAGVFMHYVLEGVTREIKATTGYKEADEELCRSLTEKYIEQYVHERLFDFEGKNARFVFLFRRLRDDVFRVVRDMLDELKVSDFEPLDFELDFSQLHEGASELRGAVDRVDGWERGGKLYLRVIDYKTGKMPFVLSDVFYGRNMQMLIYLLMLEKHGGVRYGKDIVPCGVLYVPSRDVVLNLPRNSTEDDIRKKRESELRRSGLVLGDPDVLEAMENNEAKKYLPIRLTKAGFTGDGLVSQEQFGYLFEHVANMLDSAAKDILGGSIECTPYYKGEDSNACTYCQYRALCAFDESAGDKRRIVRTMKADEVWGVLGSRQ